MPEKLSPKAKVYLYKQLGYKAHQTFTKASCLRSENFHLSPGLVQDPHSRLYPHLIFYAIDRLFSTKKKGLKRNIIESYIRKTMWLKPLNVTSQRFTMLSSFFNEYEVHKYLSTKLKTNWQATSSIYIHDN